jgi:hypothetical protein
MSNRKPFVEPEILTEVDLGLAKASFPLMPLIGGGSGGASDVADGTDGTDAPNGVD